MVLFIIAQPQPFDTLKSQKEIFINLMQGFFGANVTGSGVAVSNLQTFTQKWPETGHSKQMVNKSRGSRRHFC